MGCSQSSSVSNATNKELAKPESKDYSNYKLVTAGPAPLASQSIDSKVAFGAGCYWGTEKYIVRGACFGREIENQMTVLFLNRLRCSWLFDADFQKKFPSSIKEAKVGFMSPLSSPRIKNPTYKQVCTGQSGHVEVLFVELNDPSKHFEELCRFFFSFHDPTTRNRQGNDTGFQYSSWIFCGDDEQMEIAKKVMEELQVAIDRRAVTAFLNKKVHTRVTELSEFTEAHAAHQKYLFKNPNGYCNHRLRLKKWFELKEEK